MGTHLVLLTVALLLWTSSCQDRFYYTYVCYACRHIQTKQCLCYT